MSRAYRITVKESDTRHLKAGDEICTQLEILEILPPEDMATLLKEELKKRGFEEQEDGTMIRNDGDVTVRVDPCSGEVSVKAETEETVSQEAKRDATGFNDVGPEREEPPRPRQGSTEAGPRQEVRPGTERDSRARPPSNWRSTCSELQPEISEVVNQVTRDALKQKAQQMGTVKEISEDAESGSLTIKVEV